MAVPTITSIAPTEGLPSGRMRVLITGTNFRIPSVPALGEDLDGDWIRTVGVWFGDEPADAVVPISSTEVWAVTPPYCGASTALPVDVDVILKNQDDNEDPIAGETVTEADGFTYKREDLTAESDFTWLTYSVVQHLRRNLIQNVQVNADPDYSDDPASALTAISELPVVLLLGPAISEDTFRRHQEPSETLISGDRYTRDAAPFKFTARFDIILMSESKIEALNLCNLATRFFHKLQTFTLEDSQGSGNRIELELRIDGEWSPRDDYENRVHRYDSTLVIEGGATDDTYGVSTSKVALEDVVTTESGGEDEVPTLSTEEL